MMPPPPLPELNLDIVSEILLRLPPDDPAGLVRASAVCKPWLRTLTDPAFLRRYCDFHGTPRMLGFLNNTAGITLEQRFVPTTAFRPHAAAHHRTYSGRVVDCRHGRVLLHDYDSKEFFVWDPITGRERRIPDRFPSFYTSYAVLCAAAGTGCDHSTCSGGPFLLASAGVCSFGVGESCACFYSSETGAWGVEASLTHFYLYGLDKERPAGLVGSALYFVGDDSSDLLQYDVMGDGGLLLMSLPPACGFNLNTIVMTTGNGGLGLASYDDGMLALWSAETCLNRDPRWSQIKLINLEKLLPTDISSMSSVWLSGFAEEANLIFLSTDNGDDDDDEDHEDGIFTIDLKSLLARKVSERGLGHVFPYVSFYTLADFARGALQSPVETR